jgi:hypothetical protein
MSQKSLKVLALAVLLVLCATAASAQDSGDAPKPAMAASSASALDSDQPPDIADTRPLAGVQNLSLGSRSSHSFLLPSFGVTSALQFNGYDTSAGTSSPQSTTYLSGRLGVNKISSRSELTVDYLAAGGFSSDSNQGSSVIQSLDFAETIRGGRWSETFGEALSYLPSSSFNFGGMGGLGNLGVSLGAAGTTSGFRQDLIPNESILTNGSARVNSATMVQTGYALGYRSSLSVFGSYGTLHFLNGGLQNNSTVTTGVGYNYLLSPLNSMSISYGFSTLMLPNLPRGPDSHSVLMSFGRRVTGRLSLQIGAGPDIQLFQSPLAGSGMVLSWTANGALNYQMRSWGTGLSYNHSITGGSGVLPGAETDLFSGHAGRKLGSWQTSLGLGYSRNHALQQTFATTFAPQAWFAGVGMSRGFTNFGSLNISYNVSRESSLAGACALPACGTSGLTQSVSLGYSWGFRPIVLE